MKRLLILLGLVTASVLLVACSNQESMDREYYEVGDYGTDLVIMFNGDTGIIDAESSTTNMTINTDSKPFTIEGFSVPVVKYE